MRLAGAAQQLAEAIAPFRIGGVAGAAVEQLCHRAVLRAPAAIVVGFGNRGASGEIARCAPVGGGLGLGGLAGGFIGGLVGPGADRGAFGIGARDRAIIRLGERRNACQRQDPAEHYCLPSPHRLSPPKRCG